MDSLSLLITLTTKGVDSLKSCLIDEIIKERGIKYSDQHILESLDISLIETIYERLGEKFIPSIKVLFSIYSYQDFIKMAEKESIHSRLFESYAPIHTFIEEILSSFDYVIEDYATSKDSLDKLEYILSCGYKLDCKQMTIDLFKFKFPIELIHKLELISREEGIMLLQSISCRSTLWYSELRSKHYMDISPFFYFYLHGFRSYKQSSQVTIKGFCETFKICEQEAKLVFDKDQKLDLVDAWKKFLKKKFPHIPHKTYFKLAEKYQV